MSDGRPPLPGPAWFWAHGAIFLFAVGAAFALCRWPRLSLATEAIAAVVAITALVIILRERSR